jgi:hypothetical protein
MKTRINIKSFRNTKSPQSKKTRIQKKSRKQVKTQKQKKHSFYIVQCNNDLDDTILSRHLESLGLVPDSKAMNYVEQQYKLIAAKNKLSKNQFCNSYERHLIVKVPQDLVTADVFFYHISSTNLDKPFYKYDTFLSNVINIDYSMLNKNILYTNILKYNSGSKSIIKYFVETFLFSNKNKFQFPGNYILRPIYGFAGSGILYVHNSENLEEAIEYYKTEKDWRGRLKYNLSDITVSGLITDLLLFKGRKFHLRMYYMVAILEGEVSCFLLDNGKIITAKESYNLALPFSKDVHDTHLGSTDDDYFFSYNLTQENISSLGKDSYSQDEFNTNTILKGIREIAKGLSNIVVGISKGKPNSLLYENQRNGYHIYGLDILVKDNLEPVLIECNDKPGIGCKNPETVSRLSEIIYGWINETILEPLFKHPGKATSNARKHRTYISIDYK